MNAQPAAGQEKQQSALEQFGINLTDRARQGKLDPVIGATVRSGASARCSPAKNNPVLIGEPGVGKPPWSRPRPAHRRRRRPSR
jgi:ATP-dependent Clp protease ATP-binding subunit ClpB